jgi:hypothetical protein
LKWLWNKRKENRKKKTTKPFSSSPTHSGPKAQHSPFPRGPVSPPRPTPFQARSAPLLSSLPWLTDLWGPHVSVFLLLPPRRGRAGLPGEDRVRLFLDFLAVLRETNSYKALGQPRCSPFASKLRNRALAVLVLEFWISPKVLTAAGLPCPLSGRFRRAGELNVSFPSTWRFSFEEWCIESRFGRTPTRSPMAPPRRRPERRPAAARHPLTRLGRPSEDLGR